MMSPMTLCGLFRDTSWTENTKVIMTDRREWIMTKKISFQCSPTATDAFVPSFLLWDHQWILACRVQSREKTKYNQVSQKQSTRRIKGRSCFMICFVYLHKV